MGELHDGLFLLKKRRPARGQSAWGQPSSSAVARVLHSQLAPAPPQEQFSNPPSWLSELLEHN